jgi:hypothetical protein
MSLAKSTFVPPELKACWSSERIFASGSEVRRILPAAASAPSRASPVGRSTTSA